VPHSAIVHNEQHNIGFRSANLKPNASTFGPHRGRGAPARATGLAAYRKPAAIVRAEDKSSFFHTRHDNDAARLVEQILGSVSADALSLSSTLIALSAA
jgi:hypothetical protein